MSFNLLSEPPLMVAGGALYPYSDSLLASLARSGKYDDSEYSLGRVIGSGTARRILVPRNMAPDCDNDRRTGGLGYNFVSKFKPRSSEQERIIQETVDLLEEGHNFMVSCPTGFGKTVCALEVIARVGRKTLIIVTKEDIVSQWRDECEKILGLTFENGGLGIIQGDKIKVQGCGVVLAFINSIAKENRYPPALFESFGLCMPDECHRVGADFFMQAMFRCPAFMRCGWSATAERNDGKDEVLHSHLGPVMVSTELMPMPFKVVRVMSPWTVPLVSRKDKKTGKNKIVPLPHSGGKCMHVVKLMSKHHGRNKIFTDYIHRAFLKGRHVLIQSDIKEHLQLIADMLLSYPGIGPQHMGWYIGGMKEHEREATKLLPLILATFQMTKEATNIPRLDTLVMLTPKSDVAQIVGRVIRAPDDKMIKHGVTKAEPRVFDMVDASSPVFRGYAKNRTEFYREKYAEIMVVGEAH